MNDRSSWLAAARPGQAILAPLCVAVGSAYAHFDAQRGPGLPAHVLVTVGAFAAALGVNLVDHAWDRLVSPSPDPKTPDSESLPPLEARESAGAGIAALALAALCGFGLVPLSGATTLGYGVLAVILGAVRGAPVVGLDTLGWGLSEVAAFVALGPLAATAGFASQAGTGSSGAFLAGLPAGLIGAAALFGRRATKQDLGEDVARGTAVALPLLAAAAVTIAVRAGEYGPWARTAMLPLALAAIAAWRLPASPEAADYGRWRRLALGGAVAALACIVAAFLIASPD